MAEFRLSSEAALELENIWLYVADASGNVHIANRVLDNISEHFWLLAQHPYIGRRRDHDLRPRLRTFPANDYVIVYRIAEDDVVLILHVLHGRQDIDSLT